METSLTSHSIAIANAVFKRTWLKTLRRPVVLTFSLVQPLMWMLFFGFLFQRYKLDFTQQNISYLDFLVPGLCTMTILFGASQSGIEFIRDMQTRFLERLLTTPAPRCMLIVGKISADVSRLITQSLLVILLGLGLGAHLTCNINTLPIMIISMVLFGITFSCLSCTIALLAKSQETMATFVHLINMPLLFTSTALVPARHMPDWLAFIAVFNPVSLVVNINRSTLLTINNEQHLTSVIILFVLACFMFALSVFALKKYQQNSSYV